MRARRASALRNLGRSIGEGLAWTGLGFYGTHPPHPWTGYVIPPAEQPYLPPLSEEEFVRWTAPVKHL